MESADALIRTSPGEAGGCKSDGAADEEQLGMSQSLKREVEQSGCEIISNATSQIFIPILWQLPLGSMIVAVFCFSTPIHGWSKFGHYGHLFIEGFLSFRCSTEAEIFEAVSVYMLSWSLCAARLRHLRFGHRGWIGTVINIIVVPALLYLMLAVAGHQRSEVPHPLLAALLGYISFTVVNTGTYAFAMKDNTCAARLRGGAYAALISLVMTSCAPVSMAAVVTAIDQPWFQDRPILSVLFCVVSGQIIRVLVISSITKAARENWDVDADDKFQMATGMEYITLEFISKLGMFQQIQQDSFLFAVCTQACSELALRTFYIIKTRRECVELRIRVLSMWGETDKDEPAGQGEKAEFLKDAFSSRRPNTSVLERDTEKEQEEFLKDVRIHSFAEILSIVIVPVAWHVLSPKSHPWKWTLTQVGVGLGFEVLTDGVVYSIMVCAGIKMRPWAPTISGTAIYYIFWSALAMLYALTFRFYF
jgi:hypothetical protein